jgi:hypothetical protein
MMDDHLSHSTDVFLFMLVDTLSLRLSDLVRRRQKQWHEEHRPRYMVN